MALRKLRRYMARRQLSRWIKGKVEGIVRARTHDRGPRAVGRLLVETRPLEKIHDPQAWEVHEFADNLVVSQAETIMAQMSIGAANSALNYIELGDPVAPANPPALSDITLQQTTAQRKVATVTAAGNVVMAEVLFDTTEANGFLFTEAGLFNGLLGAGLMFARKTFAGITKTNAFQMRFTWFITFLVNTQGGDCAGVSLIGPSTVTAFTIYTAVGAEASVAATFDFNVGANNVDVYLNRQRLYPGLHYTEVASPTPPVGGPPANKGVDFATFTLIAGDEVLLVHRVLN